MSRLLHEVLCTAPGDDVSKAVVVSAQAPPSCPADGVVVAVAARPINPADLLLLQGRHVFTPTLPTNVGIEGAGVVVEAGARSQIAPGTRVAIPSGGTWRDRMALRDEGVLPLPADVDLEQAAMLSVNPFTATGLLEGVPAGACVLVNAPTSAVADAMRLRSALVPYTYSEAARTLNPVAGISKAYANPAALKK